MRAHVRNRAAAVLFTVIGAFVTWEAFQYSYASSAFLRALSMSLLALGVGYSILLVRRGRSIATAADVGTEREEATGGPFLALHVFSLVAGYVALMSVLGFLVPTILFAAIGQWSFSGSFRGRHVYYSVALAYFIFFLFFDVLGISLPGADWSIDDYFQLL